MKNKKPLDENFGEQDMLNEVEDIQPDDFDMTNEADDYEAEGSDSLESRLAQLASEGRTVRKKEKNSVKHKRAETEEKAQPASQNKGELTFTQRAARWLTDTWTDLKAGVKTNHFRRGSAAAVFTALFLVFIILINIISAALTERYAWLSPDLTKNQVYSLSDVTKELLNGLDRRVEIDIIASETACQYPDSSVDPYGHIPMATELIKRYEQYSDFVKVRFINVNEDPWFLDLIPEYRDVVGDYSVVVRSELRTRVSSYYEMLPSLSGSVDTEGSSIDLASSLTECVISSLIKTVTMDVNPSVAYIDALGGGEYIGNLLTTLSVNGFEIKTSADFAFGYEPIPSEVQTVIIASPQYDITEGGLTQLSNFLYNDGKYGKTVMIFTSPLMSEMPNLAAFMEEWGMTYDRRVVYEGDTSLVIPTLSADQFYATYCQNEYVDSEITGKYTAVSEALNIGIPRESFGNIVVNPILVSSENGYAVGSGESINISDMNPADASYKYIMAQSTLYTQSLEGEELRSDVVAAPISLLDEVYFGSSAYSNFSLIMSICNARCGISEETLNISAVSLTSVDFSVESGMITAMTIIFSYAMPLAVAIAGLVVFYRRRRL